MQRFFLTCAICLGLTAALQLYAQLITPLTRSVEPPRRPRPTAVATTNTSNASNLAAQEWLPEQEWLKTAAIRWRRSEQTFMYAETVEAEPRSEIETGETAQGDTIRMKPFAMIWKDARNPHLPPMTVVAESARIRFENRFFDETQLEDNSISLSGQDQGRIVSAALEGQIRITGPNGLNFEGQDFVFKDDADAAELYSDFPVRFWYGPVSSDQPLQVRGTSTSGLRVVFNHDPSSTLGSDMPRVSEIPKSAELRGRVVIDFLTEERLRPSKTRVTSEGPFKYEFETSTATFMEKVLVSRPQGINHKDEIECNLLALIFGSVTPPPAMNSNEIQPVSNQSSEESQSTSLLTGLELKQIRALAHLSQRTATRDRVTLRSTINGLECELDDLQYDATKRLLTLTDPDRVDVWRENAGQLQKFEAPKMEIRHTDDRNLEQLSGIGSGQFTHRLHSKSQDSPDILASWKDRLDLVPNPAERRTELIIRGSATIRQLDQMQFAGQTLIAWMPLLDEIDRGQNTTRTGKRLTQNLHPDRIPVHRIQALGNVTFVAPGIVGRRIEQIDIHVDPGQIIPLNRPEQDSAGSTEVGQEERQLTGEPVVFECPRIQGRAVFDNAIQQADIRELNGFDGVHVFRSAPDENAIDRPFEEQSIRVTAQEFSVTNEGGIRQTLTLRGRKDEQGHILDPVVMKYGEISIEGPRVVVDREKNLVTVEIDRTRTPIRTEGQVVLRFPVDRDFSGQALNPPTIADIACVEKMTFDGQRATFLQSVKATLLDSQIRAEQMTAVLNGRIDFGAERPQTTGLAIESMTCQDKVSVEMYQYGPKGDLMEILRAKMHQFEANQLTGKFLGQGPGLIQDWRRTGTRRMLVQSRGSAQSNRPADSHREYPWEFVSILFEGQLSGNMKERWTKLDDRVQLMYAPVKNANLVFKRDDLSSEEVNAGNAVWVGSDQMVVTIAGDRSRGQAEMATIEALGAAQMEGRNFNAFAHSLRYEQAKEMFTLSGKGREKATLNVQPRLSEKPSKISAQGIYLYPSKREVSVDGAKSFTSAFGGN